MAQGRRDGKGILEELKGDGNIIDSEEEWSVIQYIESKGIVKTGSMRMEDRVKCSKGELREPSSILNE